MPIEMKQGSEPSFKNLSLCTSSLKKLKAAYEPQQNAFRQKATEYEKEYQELRSKIYKAKITDKLSEKDERVIELNRKLDVTRDKQTDLTMAFYKVWVKYFAEEKKLSEVCKTLETRWTRTLKVITKKIKGLRSLGKASRSGEA
jgi:hypothetical protein